jgi:hypothetical protein
MQNKTLPIDEGWGWDGCRGGSFSSSKFENSEPSTDRLITNKNIVTKIIIIDLFQSKKILSESLSFDEWRL